MSIEWVNRAVDDLRAWGQEKDVEVDVDEVRLLCDYASDYLEVNELGDFRPGTFEELLLEIYPRKVIAPPESAGETVAAARTLVEFLVDTGEIGAKTADRIRVALDEIEPEMPAALADTSKFGMAKSIFSAIDADSLDLADPLAVQRAVDELDGLDEDACDCPGCAPLPAVRLASPSEIAHAVREVPLLRDAHQLVMWMTEGGRTATVKKALRVKDAREVERELGVGRPGLAWRLALDLGLVRLEGTAVLLEEGFVPLESREEEDLLDLWAATVEFLIEAPVEITGNEAVDESVYAVHDLLYRLQVPVPPDSVGEYLRELAVGERVEGVDEALERLVYTGTVHHVDGGVALTPHGLWGLRELYLEIGLEPPIAADLAEGDASGLVSGLITSGLPAEVAEGDIDRWLAQRTPEQAAAELLGAVVGAPAEMRGIAVTIVDRLPAEAESAVTHCLDDPELRPHAIHWLASRGLPAPALTQDELLWVSVDMLALALPAAQIDPDGFAENMAVSGPPPHLIEDMWRVEHPDVVEVLELLGNTLPDKITAKAARKAAFKARSRGIR
ncbi:hypothetical protein [Microtetraspora malaysiensis]|uniref:hypothetical protein n=1 Tax=Microtetraspora malaysiensis TaxID=161358 RepID=UPI00083066BF|nr:hypothetical protein [Microtetraspora malaysiensis]